MVQNRKKLKRSRSDPSLKLPQSSTDQNLTKSKWYHSFTYDELTELTQFGLKKAQPNSYFKIINKLKNYYVKGYVTRRSGIQETTKVDLYKANFFENQNQSQTRIDQQKLPENSLTSYFYFAVTLFTMLRLGTLGPCLAARAVFEAKYGPLSTISATSFQNIFGIASFAMFGAELVVRGAMIAKAVLLPSPTIENQPWKTRAWNVLKQDHHWWGFDNALRWFAVNLISWMCPAIGLPLLCVGFVGDLIAIYRSRTAKIQHLEGLRGKVLEASKKDNEFDQNNSLEQNLDRGIQNAKTAKTRGLLIGVTFLLVGVFMAMGLMVSPLSSILFCKLLADTALTLGASGLAVDVLANREEPKIENSNKIEPSNDGQPLMKDTLRARRGFWEWPRPSAPILQNDIKVAASPSPRI